MMKNEATEQKYFQNMWKIGKNNRFFDNHEPISPLGDKRIWILNIIY